MAIVFAQTIVEAPKNGASRRAAAISAPRLAAPTTKTTSWMGGAPRRTAAQSSRGRSDRAPRLASGQ